MIRDPSDGSVRETDVLIHLQRTFDLACRDFRDIMEPYVNRVPEGAPPDEIKRFMRGALRETFTARWPLRDYRAGKINPKDE
jgi:hypothetical protein